MGMDLHGYYLYGKTALITAVEGTKPSDFVEYLLENGVDTKRAGPGPDALDYALAQLDTFNSEFSGSVDVVKNVALMFKYKVKREEIHQQKIYELSQINPKVLDVVSTILPDYKIGTVSYFSYFNIRASMPAPSNNNDAMGKFTSSEEFCKARKTPPAREQTPIKLSRFFWGLLPD